MISELADTVDLFDKTIFYLSIGSQFNKKVHLTLRVLGERDSIQFFKPIVAKVDSKHRVLMLSFLSFQFSSGVLILYPPIKPVYELMDERQRSLSNVI